jgi:hypothetical protein
MYFWKCWRETRASFSITAGLLAALSLLIMLGLVYYPIAGFRQGVLTPHYIAYLWGDAVRTLGIALAFAAPVVGARLGAFGVGAEFESGSILFLATRPRSHRYWIWMAWGVGLTELLVLCLVPVAVMLPALLHFTGNSLLKPLFELVPLMFVTQAVAFGVGYLATVVLRSARHAMALAAVLLMAYIAAEFVLKLIWNVPPVEFWVVFAQVGIGKGFPGSMVAEWLLVALMFPLIADMVFEDAEI